MNLFRRAIIRFAIPALILAFFGFQLGCLIHSTKDVSSNSEVEIVDKRIPVTGIEEMTLAAALRESDDSRFSYLAQFQQFKKLDVETARNLLFEVPNPHNFLFEICSQSNSKQQLDVVKPKEKLSHYIQLFQKNRQQAASDLIAALSKSETRLDLSNDLVRYGSDPSVIAMLEEEPKILTLSGQAQSILESVSDSLGKNDLARLRGLVDKLPGDLHKIQVYRNWAYNELVNDVPDSLEIIGGFATESDKFWAFETWLMRHPGNVAAAQTAIPEVFSTESFQKKASLLVETLVNSKTN